jgi:hypothetical protein
LGYQLVLIGKIQKDQENEKSRNRDKRGNCGKDNNRNRKRRGITIEITRNIITKEKRIICCTGRSNEFSWLFVAVSLTKETFFSCVRPISVASERQSVSHCPFFFERMRTRIAYDARRALHVAVHIKREEQFSEIIHKLSSEPTTTST